jgi:error-prone DNA polymerase
MKRDAPPYAELHCLSNFTFLRGASHPEELVARAADLGYRSLAITDECSLAGVVRAHAAARQHDLHLIIGSEFYLEDGLHLILLAPDRAAYGRLSALIALGRSQATKGTYHLTRSDLQDGIPGCLALLVTDTNTADDSAHWVARTFPGRAWLTTSVQRDGLDTARFDHCRALASRHGLRATASSGALMHRRSRRALQDTLTAVRLQQPISALGHALAANGERHLRSRARLARDYPRDMLAEALRIARRCRFSLDELRYEYPEEVVPSGFDANSYLRQQVALGAAKRWPQYLAALCTFYIFL